MIPEGFVRVFDGLIQEGDFLTDAGGFEDFARSYIGDPIKNDITLYVYRRPIDLTDNFL